MSRHPLRFSAAVVLALAVLPVQAQVLGLRAAAELALHNDPRMQATIASVGASTALVEQARAGYLPSVMLSADVGRSNLQTNAPFPQSGARTPNDLSLGISQPLYTGGATAALEDAADATLVAARQSQRDAGGKIILAALTAYLDTLRDGGVVELSRISVSTLEKAQSDIEKRLAAGEATRTDVAQASARVAEARASLSRAQAQKRISEAAMLRLTGQRAAQLDGRWPEPAVPASLDEALRLSAQAPFVQAAEANAAASKSQIDFAGAGRLPRVSLDGNASTSDNTEFGYERLTTWGVLLKLQVPIYEGGLARAKVTEAAAKSQQAEFQADDARRQFAESATREWESLQAAQEMIRAYEAQVVAAESALDGVRKELDAGTRTTLDLLDAERELLVAQVNLVASKRDRAVTAFRLIAACGKLELEAIPL